MRTGLPTLMIAVLLAAPLQGQTCRKVPPPFLPDLFPERALGLDLQFATDPTGGCTAMYRPDSQAARASRAWAMVTIEANPAADLGETAEGIRTRFTPPLHTLFTMGDWPVVMRLAPLGDEFVAHKGSVRVVVLVKNGDQGETSRALAEALLVQILPKVPCG